MDNTNFHFNFEDLKILAFTVTQIALKSLQETQNNCFEKQEHTIIQNSLDSVDTLLWKFFIFQPVSQNSLLPHLGVQHFDLPTTDCTFFCSKRAQTGWNTILASHVAPQHQAGREASCSESQVYSTDYTAKMLRQQELLLSHKRLGKQSLKASFFHSMHRLRDMPRSTTWPALQLLKVHRAERIKNNSKVTTKASFICNFQKWVEDTQTLVKKYFTRME